MSSGKKIFVQLAVTCTVKVMKLEISSKTDIPPQDQKLMYYKAMLQDEKKLSEYNLQNNSTVELHESKSSVLSLNSRCLNVICQKLHCWYVVHKFYT